MRSNQISTTKETPQQIVSQTLAQSLPPRPVHTLDISGSGPSSPLRSHISRSSRLVLPVDISARRMSEQSVLFPSSVSQPSPLARVDPLYPSAFDLEPRAQTTTPSPTRKRARFDDDLSVASSKRHPRKRRSRTVPRELSKDEERRILEAFKKAHPNSQSPQKITIKRTIVKRASLIRYAMEYANPIRGFSNRAQLPVQL